MPEIPAEAVTAAMVRRADLLADRPDPMVLSDETLTRLMLEAAAPILAADLSRKVKKLRKRVKELEPYEPRTKGLSIAEDGTPVVDVHFPESFAQLMLANFRWYLDEHDAPNYVQLPMTDMTTGETYECFIGRPGGKSPHDLRKAAEARVAQLEAELAQLRGGSGA